MWRTRMIGKARKAEVALQKKIRSQPASVLECELPAKAVLHPDRGGIRLSLVDSFALWDPPWFETHTKFMGI